ncbi:MAG: nucleoside deaminase [Clostridiales bacterium]|nr:nucleoside deaminase [Clostridiales bacterium]
MEKAIQQAKKAYNDGEIPIGCVIVCDEKIIASAHNTKQNCDNSLHHAEILALDRAMKTLGTKYLNNCTMYLTIEPCAMCAGAMINCRLGKLVFGAREPKTGCAGSIYNLLEDNRFNHRVIVEEGVMQEECSCLMKEFFISRRNKC